MNLPAKSKAAFAGFRLQPHDTGIKVKGSARRIAHDATDRLEPGSMIRRLSAANECDCLFLGALEISDKRVFVLREIRAGPCNLTMKEAFVDLADKKSKLVAIESH